MKNLFFFGLLFLFLFSGCRPDRSFRKAARELDKAYENHSATLDFDPFFPIFPEDQLQTHIRFCEEALTSLGTFPPSSLQAGNQERHRQLTRIWQSRKDSLMRFQVDPSLYNLGGYLKKILTDRDLSLEERLQKITIKMSEADAFFESAKRNLQNPSAEKALLAAQKQLMTLRFLRQELPDSLRSATLSPSDREIFLDRTRNAQLAVKDYLAFCESLVFDLKEAALQKDGEISRSVGGR